MSRLNALARKPRHQGAPVATPPEETADVEALSQLLASLVTGARKTHKPHFELVDPRGARRTIPQAVLEVLGRATEVLARGDAVSVVAVDRLLTTGQAADLLNVSRQYLVRLLDTNEIPFTRTGTHRRIRVADILGYKQRRDRERRAALDELTQLSEELNGYHELK